MGLMNRIRRYTEDRAYRKGARARAEAHAQYVGRNVRRQKIRERERERAQKKFGAYVPGELRPGSTDADRVAARAKSRKRSATNAAKLLESVARNAGTASDEVVFGPGKKLRKAREPQIPRGSDVDPLFFSVDVSEWMPGGKRRK